MSVHINFSFHVEEASIRLDAFLATQTGKSRAYIQEQIGLGAVFVNKKPVTKASLRLKAGDEISGAFAPNLTPSPLEPIPGNLDIIYEDNDLLAINKSAGVVVHPGSGVRDATLVHYLLHHLKNSEFAAMAGPDSERPGIVHRLDIGTSGLILVAKSREILDVLSAAFKQRKIKKQYEAIAWGKMPLTGVYESTIGRDRRNRQKMSTKTEKGRHAVTRWKALERFQHFTYVELYPETGRTHQLRVHLSEGGHSIVGDPTYGRANPKRSLLAEPLTAAIAPLNHTLLHAKALTFAHPRTQKLVQLSAEAPSDFLNFLQLLRENDACPTK